MLRVSLQSVVAVAELLNAEELNFLTTIVDAEFTRVNNLRSLSKRGGFRERRFAQCVAFQDLKKPGSDYYNRVVGFAEDSVGELPEIVRWYESAGLNCVVSLPPPVQTKAVLKALATEGFSYESSDFVYCVRPQQQSEQRGAANVEVQKVTRESLEALLALMDVAVADVDQTLRDRFCAPDFEYYLALIDDKPVARASVFFFEGVAWFNNAVTEDPFRGRGCHTALLRARLVAARERHCRLAVSDTVYGSASHRNLLRAGFQLGFSTAELKRLVLVPPASAG